MTSAGQANRVAALRAAWTAWLARPLTSFHLVLAVFGLLTAIGLVMVLSASSVESYSLVQSSYWMFKKQLIYTGVGLVLFWIGLRVPLRALRRLSGPAVLLSVLLLALVLTPLGHKVNGARAWFVLGGMSFQPVEPAKLALALWGAHVLVTKRALLRQYRHLLVPVVPVALVMFALVMLEPDLGSTVTLGVVLIGLLWFVGAPMRLFAALAAGGLAGVGLLAVGASYRLARVASFLNPESDPSGAAYQARQALYALADGGLLGKGLGQGASKWFYLPNVYNDFIFALIGEELGFLGCAVVLGLFATLAVVGMRIAARNTDPWIRLVAATLTTWLVAQAAINIGYVIGMLPITGITLPLISWGGTSVVTTMLVFGILANCARHEPEAVATLRNSGEGRLGRLLRLPVPDPYRPPARRRPARPSTPPKRAGRPTGAVRGGAAHLADDRRRTRRAASTKQQRRRAADRTAPRRTSHGR
ncbi:putative lipid II flippase FtsW [Gandjariella thermophila]|uniref:Probable peptidoglycan glycosyltransferase FtsW n=1 Tax=Gandjariella thermophila TaxID=1931992 RepID=A0A4D4JB75_9PSEU|nr:putative lipid II flippase FtsW [Gandjariella thermophila]GDY32814.1 cell division protein FtsW [Gandjariella thermophila]